MDGFIFVENFEKLGLMGWPLLLTSIAALAITGERAVHFWHWRLRARTVRQRLRVHIEGGRIEAAEASIKDIPSPLAQLAYAYLEGLNNDEATRKAMAENSVQKWLSSARGPIKTLGTLAQIAPLLGLTGTVLGLVAAFQVIQASERAISPALLAGGIWEALLTTVVGMLISIPLIIAIRFFNARLDAVQREARDLFVWIEHYRVNGHFTAPATPEPEPSRETLVS